MGVNENALMALLDGLGEIGRAILALQATVGGLAREAPPAHAPSSASTPQATPSPTGSGTLREQLDAYELHVVTQALARHAGNVTRAAVELGVTREGLHKIMRSKGILAEKWRPAD